MAVGDGGEPFEALIAVDMVHAPEDHLGRGSGELAEGLVDLGQEGGVVGGCSGAGRRWPGGFPRWSRMWPVPAVLLDEAGHLGPGQAGHLLEEPLRQALVGLPEAVVLEADQRAANEGVGGAAVGEFEVRRFAAVQEGPDLLEGTNPFRCEVSRSSSNDLFAPHFRLTPRWKPDPRSGSLAVGQDSPLRFFWE